MYHLNLTVDLFASILYTILYSVFIIVCVLIAVAYFTLLDRKIMAAVQRRKGPNVVGI
jgi:NADH:ubiquinone oxidoreductase subunit H